MTDLIAGSADGLPGRAGVARPMRPGLPDAKAATLGVQDHRPAFPLQNDCNH
jgi:hypothetical protein